MTEDQLQAKCYQWAYNTYPQLRGLLFSVPNGGTRNKIEAMKLKATGLTPGIPDMLLIHPVFAAFELKSEIGVLSPAQKKIHEIWANAGIEIYIIKDFDYFVAVINKIVTL